MGLKKICLVNVSTTQVWAVARPSPPFAALRHPSPPECCAGRRPASASAALLPPSAALRLCCRGPALVSSLALALVLVAMGAHRTDHAVQIKGCRALANCAFSAEGEADVLARGGDVALGAGVMVAGKEARRRRRPAPARLAPTPLLIRYHLLLGERQDRLLLRHHLFFGEHRCRRRPVPGGTK